MKTTLPYMSNHSLDHRLDLVKPDLAPIFGINLLKNSASRSKCFHAVVNDVGDFFLHNLYWLHMLSFL